MRRLSLTLIAAIAVLLAAAAVTSAADTRTLRVPSVGLSFSVPKSWRTVDARVAAGQAGRTLRKENPQLAGLLDTIAQPNSPVKLLAFDPKPVDNFSTNVNVVVSPVPSTATFDQLRQATADELGKLPGLIGTPTVWVTTLPAGRTIRTKLRAGIVVDGKTKVAEINQMAFLRSAKSIVVTFTTIASNAKRFKPVVNAGARSIRFS
ncbi:MAG: hypothetical protein ACKVUT_15685 [Gaiella sp.]